MNLHLPNYSLLTQMFPLSENSLVNSERSQNVPLNDIADCNKLDNSVIILCLALMACYQKQLRMTLVSLYMHYRTDDATEAPGFPFRYSARYSFKVKQNN